LQRISSQGGQPRWPSATTTQPAAAFELLGRRYTHWKGQIADGPAAAARLARAAISDNPTGQTFAVYLDSNLRVLGWATVARNFVTAAYLSSREVFLPGVKLGADAFYLVRRHSDGSTDPTTSERLIAARLSSDGDRIGVPMLDHILLGNGERVLLAVRG